MTPERFVIQIDPRIELLSIVLNFSEWPYFGKFADRHLYHRAVLEHFQAFKDHEAVHWFNAARNHWNLDDPATGMLWLSNPPEMRVIHPYPLHPTCQMSILEFERMVELLNQFAADADFMVFWEANQSRYRRFEMKIREVLPFEEHIRLMVDFYGEEKTQFWVIPAPLFERVSFGPQLKTAAGLISYFITAFNNTDDGEPAFSTSLLRMLIFHEFGHSFVNPICEDYRKEIFEYKHLFEYIKADMSAITYTDWFPAVHEHIVRAGECLLLERAGYYQEAAQNYKRNLWLGFALLPLLREKMEYYTHNRDRCPTFRKFFPEILGVLSKAKPVAYARPVPLGMTINQDGARFFVKRLQRDGAARQTGFLVGDQIMSVNGLALTKPDDIYKVQDIWYGTNPGERVRFSISRGGRLAEFFVDVPFVGAYKFV